LKRSKLSYDEWKCIKSKKIRGKNVITDFFEGYLGLIKIEQVTEPQIWEFNGEKIDVCNSGLKWLSILPENDFYCITAMLNEKNEILLWYIDMIADKGTDEDGIPYFDDLYLDLVVYPNGTIIEDDMDELEEALLIKDISEEQYDLAINTSILLKEGILKNIETFISYTYKCLEMFD
jgi:uncharacterized protein